MTPESQRIAIAEACPSLFIVGASSFGLTQLYRNDDGRKGSSVDPLHDLNAMHEAEKVAIRGHYDMEYRETLERVCNEGYAAIVYATAAQRAEAFLRTLNPWKDEV